MKVFHILTIFPSFFEGPLRHGVVAKAVEAGKIAIRIHNLRDWAEGRHAVVDDRPFGGGEGMVLKVEPVYRALEAILPKKEGDRGNTRVVLLSAQGQRLNQAVAQRLAEYDEVLFICGRYEGVDERITEHLVDEEITIGDYVLSGGELAAAVVLDTVARLVPGVLGNEASSQYESFSEVDEKGQPLLDCPHYTRPADFNGWQVPQVLLSGNHAEIKRWRAEQARAKRQKNRPDLAGGTEERGN